MALDGIQDSFEVLELELSEEELDFIYYIIFKESENTEKMKYGVLLTMLDEIDDVLETNAEEFVKSYIQKGGE